VLTPITKAVSILTGKTIDKAVHSYHLDRQAGLSICAENNQLRIVSGGGTAQHQRLCWAGV